MCLGLRPTTGPRSQITSGSDSIRLSVHLTNTQFCFLNFSTPVLYVTLRCLFLTRHTVVASLYLHDSVITTGSGTSATSEWKLKPLTDGTRSLDYRLDRVGCLNIHIKPRPSESSQECMLDEFGLS